MNITSNLLAANCPYTFIDVVPVDVIPSLETLLQTCHFLDRELRDECLEWRTWTVARFCKELRLAVPDVSVDVIPSLETLLQTRHFLDRELRDECLTLKIRIA
jgi:hypothetical protein